MSACFCSAPHYKQHMMCFNSLIKKQWVTHTKVGTVYVYSKLQESGKGHVLLTAFQGMIPWESIATWSGVDFTWCCTNLFVVERITVTDLVANKISGSGSCLIGKLQNSPVNCEASCCPASGDQEGNQRKHKQIHQDRRTSSALCFTPSDRARCCRKSIEQTLKSKAKFTTKSFCLSFRGWAQESCLFIELDIMVTHTQESLCCLVETGRHPWCITPRFIP